MAKLNEYRAQVAPRPSAAAQVSRSGVLGAAVAGFGQQMQQSADLILERRQRREAFKANADFRMLEQNLNRALDTAAQDAPADGAGVYDGYVAKSLDPLITAFEANLPTDNKSLNDQMLANIALLRDKYDYEAAKVEHGAVVTYQTGELDRSANEASTQISMNPDTFDSLLQQNIDLIDSTSLSAAQKREAKYNWSQLAMKSYFSGEVQRNPTKVWRMLGGETSALTPAARVYLTTDALANVDVGKIGGNRVTVSNMRLEDVLRLQTAVEPDGNGMSPKATRDEWEAYLQQPGVGASYATALVKEMQGEFGTDTEAVVVGFLAGKKAAKAYVKRRDGTGSQDPMEALPVDVRRAVKRVTAAIHPPSTTSDDVRFNWVRGGANRPLTGKDVAGIDPRLMPTVAQAFAAAGLTDVNVRSAVRGEEHNRDVGGASRSQHVVTGADGQPTGRSGALDIDLPANMPVEKKVELLARLSAAGVSGIGVYKNSIHVDMGPRRMWGGDFSSGSIPAWAEGVARDHAAGKVMSPPARNVAPRFATLSESARQQALGNAYTAMNKVARDATPDIAAIRVQSARLLDEVVTTLRQTGEAPQGVDPQQLVATLTPAQQQTYGDKLVVAGATHELTADIETMSRSEMTSMVEDAKRPQGAVLSVNEQRVADAVERAAKDEQAQRETDPAGSTLAFGNLQDEWAKVVSPTGDVAPGAVQAWIKESLRVQRDVFQLDTRDQRALPRAASVKLAEQIARITRAIDPEKTISTGKGDRQVKSLLLDQFVRRMYGTYGEFTDEVLYSALKELAGSGVDKVNSDGTRTAVTPESQLIADMSVLATGSLPVRLQEPEVAAVTPFEYNRQGTAVGAPGDVLLLPMRGPAGSVYTPVTQPAPGDVQMRPVRALQGPAGSPPRRDAPAVQPAPDPTVGPAVREATAAENLRRTLLGMGYNLNR